MRQASFDLDLPNNFSNTNIVKGLHRDKMTSTRLTQARRLNTCAPERITRPSPLQGLSDAPASIVCLSTISLYGDYLAILSSIKEATELSDPFSSNWPAPTLSLALASLLYDHSAVNWKSVAKRYHGETDTRVLGPSLRQSR